MRRTSTRCAGGSEWSASPDPQRRGGAHRADLVAVACVVACTLATFAPAVDGAFVYDDRPQIVENPLLRAETPIGDALAADVWAQRAPDEEAASPYWRPTFVLWLRAQLAAFGTVSARPWHLAAIALHGAVAALAYGFARVLGLATWPAAAAALLFAVHPTRVESVAWISGATDPLAAVFVLLALLAWHRRSAAAGWRSGARWIAMACFVLALGAKEIAIVLPLVIASLPREGERATWRARAIDAAPWAALSIGYGVARAIVIGGAAQVPPDAVGSFEQILTAPRLLLFYAPQALWPDDVSLQHALRAVRVGDVGALALGAEALGALLVIACAVFVARMNAILCFGLLWFALFLAPVFWIRGFPFDQLVHDRYLYLPLLGIGIVLAAAAARLPRQWRGLVFAAAAVGLGTLAVQTARATRVWREELALWEHAVVADPRSATAWTQYAEALLRAGRAEPAREAVERALAIAPLTAALVLRSEIATAEGRLVEAEADLRRVHDAYPELRSAAERLAALHQRQGRIEEAELVLESLLAAAPAMRCSTLVNLAILSHARRDVAETDARLGEAALLTENDTSGACAAALFHRAALREEQGVRSEAARLVDRYLERTRDLEDRTTARLRPLAIRLRERVSADRE